MIKQRIYIRENKCEVSRWKYTNPTDTLNSYINEDAASKLQKIISNIRGVSSVDIVRGSLDVVDFPMGFDIYGEYDPFQVLNAVTSNDCSILANKISRN